MKRNNVFTIVNSLPLKQIQSNQKESLIEKRKLDSELQCIQYTHEHKYTFIHTHMNI